MTIFFGSSMIEVHFRKDTGVNIYQIQDLCMRRVAAALCKDLSVNCVQDHRGVRD